MGSPAAQKGANFERLIVDFFRREIGPWIDRGRAGATDDRGDITGFGSAWTFELKNYKNLAAGINQGLADLVVEQANAGTTHGAVIVKRHGKGKAEDQLFIMRLGDALPLIKQGAGL